MIITTDPRKVAVRKENGTSVKQRCWMRPKCKSWTKGPVMCPLCMGIMLLAVSSLATLVWAQHVLPFPPLPWQAGSRSGRLLSDRVEFPSWCWRTSSTLQRSEGRWTRGRWVGEGSRAETRREGLASSLKSFLCVFKIKQSNSKCFLKVLLTRKQQASFWFWSNQPGAAVSGHSKNYRTI